jgi:hypothetical protein
LDNIIFPHYQSLSIVAALYSKVVGGEGRREGTHPSIEIFELGNFTGNNKCATVTQNLSTGKC